MRRWLKDRHHLLGPILLAAGILLVPWLLYLSFTLPDHAKARNWSLMWTGLDVVEAAALIVTGAMQLSRHHYRSLAGAFASALLLMDTWVDVTTSAPGHAKVLAIVMAVVVELPIAAACAAIAVTGFPARERVPV